MANGSLSGIPPIILGDDEFDGKGRIQNTMKNLLGDSKTTIVKIISFMAQYNILKGINFLKKREQTQLILYPPNGISRSDVANLLLHKNANIEIQQIFDGSEKVLPHLKMILVKNNDKRYATIGSSNITFSGYNKNIETNVLLSEDTTCAEDMDKLWDLYEDLWTNYSCPIKQDNFCVTIKDEFALQQKNLLPFQEKVYEQLNDRYDDFSHQRTVKNSGAILSLPTGAGKTLVAVRFILNRVLTDDKKKVLWIAPREELVMQAFITFMENNQFFLFENLLIDPPENHKKWNSSSVDVNEAFHVIFRTTQSEHLNSSGKFDLVVVDEAHWGSSKKSKMLPKILDIQKDAFKLGITATPFRRSPTEIGHINELFGDPIYRC